MSMWKDNTAPRPSPVPAPEPKEALRVEPPKPQYTPVAAAAAATRPDPNVPRKESLIAPDITIEGKIEGGGSVRVAGELEGDIEESSRVELQQTGMVTGDVKAGSLTVAAGARMRGHVEFGWDDSGKPGKGNRHGAG